MSTGTHGSRIFYAVAGSAVTPLMSLATAPILAQALGVEGRGDLAAGMAPMLFAVAVGGLGIPEALTFHVARQARGARRSVRRAFALLTVLGILSAGAVAWSAPLLAGDNPDIRQLMYVTAVLCVPTYWASIPASVLAGTHAWKLSAVVDFSVAVVRLLLLAALAWTDALIPLSATVVMLGVPLIKGVATFPYLLKYRRGHGSATAKRVRLLSYGSRLWIGSLAGVMLLRLDQLLMVPLAGAVQLGLYAVAVSVGEIPAVLAGAVRNVVFSADAAEADDGGATDRLQQTARLTSAAAVGAGLAIGPVLPWAVPLFFGPQFEQAVAVAWVVLAGVVLGTPGSVAGAGLSARGRPGLRSWGMVIGALFNTAVLLAAVPALGALGAALATVAGSVIAGTMNIVWLRLKFGIRVAGFYGLRRSDLQLVLKKLVRTTRKKNVHAVSI